MPHFSFLYRIVLRSRPKRAYETLRSTALAEWEPAYRRALADRDAGQAEPLQRGYIHYVEENQAVFEGKSILIDYLASGWAAHFLPLDLYGVYSHGVVIEQSQGVLALIAAGKAAGQYRQFAMDDDVGAEKPKPRPRLETADERQLRMAWDESEPLFRAWEETPESAAEKIADLGPDDLHEIVCNLTDAGMAGMVVAIAEHPALDRGTALEVLYAFSAASYQRFWRVGDTEQDFGKEDQLLFRAFETIARRAHAGSFATGRFLNRYHEDVMLREYDGEDVSDDPMSPCNWEKWQMPEDALRLVEGLPHAPMVTGDHGVVRLSFEAWKVAETERAQLV